MACPSKPLHNAWLFSNTPGGAEASSATFSIIETAKENDFIPFRYLKFSLETLQGLSAVPNLAMFLPWRVGCRIGAGLFDAYRLHGKFYTSRLQIQPKGVRIRL